MLESLAVELRLIQAIIKVYAKLGGFYEQHQRCKIQKAAKK